VIDHIGNIEVTFGFMDRITKVIAILRCDCINISLRIRDLFLESIFRLVIIEEFIELFIIFGFRIFISETAKRVIGIEEETAGIKLGRS